MTERTKNCIGAIGLLIAIALTALASIEPLTSAQKRALTWGFCD